MISHSHMQAVEIAAEIFHFIKITDGGWVEDN